MGTCATCSHLHVCGVAREAPIREGERCRISPIAWEAKVQPREPAMELRNQRDAEGKLTIVASALDGLGEMECDCGDESPCARCIAIAAIEEQEKESARLRAENLKWQSEHTALKLDYHNAEAELSRSMRPSSFDRLPRVVRHLLECARMAANDEARAAYEIAAGIVEHELKQPPLVPVQRPSAEAEG